MQLPRGQFHRLIKSTTSRALIEEMGSKRFTGICTILLGNKSAVLVLNEGQVVLAEYGGIKGQQALEKIHDGEEGEAAAELNLLTPDQIQLALEFNQSFAIGNQTDSSPRKAASGGAKPSAGPGKTGATSVQKRRPEPPAERHRIPMPGVKPVRETAAAPPSGDDEINTLIRNMEEMDVEELVSSFRVNCKDMLKKIHLDHLIQEKDT
ncbi:DUF4388 domain-containing protein [Methanoculleus bourgensis]|uniref:hypothetical protein n=1 Tax=Methanoculleus bourgensis TaxID=83986 RepID=UPI00179A6C47|nr:hypothetical protein [Methanoculleus bourgensis]MBT0732313.1 DUF4388 domain-containing protein [Methanoculleus bourgensis]NMA88255.1 hypothetical protein [Methanoculleus bourgensis]